MNLNILPDQLQQVETRYFSLKGILRAKYMTEVAKINRPLAGHLARLSQSQRKATRTPWADVRQKFLASSISNLPQGSFFMGGWNGEVSKDRRVAILTNELDNTHVFIGSFERLDGKASTSTI